MLGKVYHILSIVGIATMLAWMAFFGYLVLFEGLDAERSKTIGAVLRGELDDYWEQQAAAQQADSETAMADTEPNPPDAPQEDAKTPSSEEVQAQRQEQSLRGHLLDQQIRVLRSQKELVDQALQELLGREEKFKQDVARFETLRTESIAALREEGFQQELEYLSSLKPDQAKEHLIRTWEKHPQDAVRLFKELDVDRGKRILERMKTPEELEIMSALLEQLRLQEFGSGVASGKADDASAP